MNQSFIHSNEISKIRFKRVKNKNQRRFKNYRDRVRENKKKLI